MSCESVLIPPNACAASLTERKNAVYADAFVTPYFASVTDKIRSPKQESETEAGWFRGQPVGAVGCVAVRCIAGEVASAMWELR